MSCTRTGELTLVRDGEATSVIIIPDDPNRMQIMAVEDFVKTINISTGAEIDVINEDDALSVSDDMVRIIIGPSDLTQELGYPGNDLKDEEFRLHSVNGNLIVLSKDIIQENPLDNIWLQPEAEHTRTTQWALGYILDHHLGVRWIWPGELGTSIPKHKNVVLPKLDLSFQQPILRRCFNVVESNPENLLWLNYHGFAGGRLRYHFRHSFREGADNGTRYSKEEVWNRSKGIFFTDRYVWFWNQLVRKMREQNPDVKVGIYLFGAYRKPPTKLEVEKGIEGELVHTFDFSKWKDRQESGIEEIALRPNWLYMGACAPHLPLYKIGNYNNRPGRMRR